MSRCAIPSFADSGSLDACRKCEGVLCCGKGGTIGPPYLTVRDVERISHKTGMPPDIFSNPMLNHHTGNMVRMMKTNSKDGCHFLELGRCRIHEFRPVDCRLFPLDIKKIGDELHWVIYGYEDCILSERDHGVILEQIPTALAVLGDETIDYATAPVPGMERVGYKSIAKVSEIPSAPGSTVASSPAASG